MVYCCFSFGASKANYEFEYKFILFPDPTIFGQKSNMLSLDFHISVALYAVQN